MRYYIRFPFALALILFGQMLYSQTTMLGTDPDNVIGLRWLGWSTNEIPLDLRTSNTVRMRINKNTNTTISGFPVNTSGFVGISNQFNFFQSGGGLGPYSMLHLNGGNNLGVQTFGYRNWMKYGMTITSNQDLMYVGHRAYGMDQTDAVISWSDNAGVGPYGPDRMRFIFSGNYDTSSSEPKNSLEGKEIMVMYPESGYVGIGNYSPENIVPTESIDAFETARLRGMPSESPQVLITGVEVSGEGDYQLNYKEFTAEGCDILTGNGSWTNIETLLENCADLNLEGEADCDWAVNPLTNDVVTALDLPGGWGDECAQPVDSKVGIGTATPIAKLSVLNDQSDETESIEVSNWVWMDGSVGASSMNFGIWSDTHSDGSNINTAVTGTAKNARTTTGGNFRSEATTSSLAALSYGVKGEGYNLHTGVDTGNRETFGVHGYAESASAASFSAGVYGDVLVNAVNNHWAGWFDGRTYCGGTIFPSDQKLKKNIENLENGLELIMNLNPKTYEFRNDEFPSLNLSLEPQYGLISQEVEKVLPALVSDIASPSKRDSLGNIVNQGVEFKGMNYQSLIPILVQATKEQQGIIEKKDLEIQKLQSELESLDERMKAIEEFLDLRSAYEVEKTLNSSENACIIAPNPFKNETEIQFTTKTSGTVRISLLDSKGAQVSTIFNGTLESGQHSQRLDGASLQSGVYYCLIELDGQEIAKRLIKTN